MAASLVSFTTAGFAQSEFHHLTFNAGGGVTAPTGRIGSDLDIGGNFEAAAGLNLTRYLGVLGTFSFQGVGLTGGALQRLNEPDGNARIYTFTIDPKITFPLRRGKLLRLGGGGWMRPHG